MSQKIGIFFVILYAIVLSNSSLLKPKKEGVIPRCQRNTSTLSMFDRSLFSPIIFSTLKQIKELYTKKIMIGTQWCGNGSRAENDTDFGKFVKTDKCCRAHDKCDDIILAGEDNHGLTNPGTYTRSNCECDRTFHRCLEQARDGISIAVGAIYFNGLGVDGCCFELTPPATCIKSESVFGYRPRCADYKYDKSQPKEWQWFDGPRWWRIPL